METKPDEVLEIFLQPGEFYFGENATRIRTLVGSCVAITMWHPALRIGGMCHYMLPRRSREPVDADEALDGHYADDAMQMFLREIARAGTSPADYQVKLFGGGRMFAGEARPARLGGVSESNVICGRAAIAACGFRLSAEDLGGFGHRNVWLDLWSGEVWVRRSQPATAGLLAGA